MRPTTQTTASSTPVVHGRGIQPFSLCALHTGGRWSWQSKARPRRIAGRARRDVHHQYRVAGAALKPRCCRGCPPCPRFPHQSTRAHLPVIPTHLPHPALPRRAAGGRRGPSLASRQVAKRVRAAAASLSASSSAIRPPLPLTTAVAASGWRACERGCREPNGHLERPRRAQPSAVARGCAHRAAWRLEPPLAATAAAWRAPLAFIQRALLNRTAKS